MSRVDGLLEIISYIISDLEAKEAQIEELQNTIEDIKKGNPQECEGCGRIG